MRDALSLDGVDAPMLTITNWSVEVVNALVRTGAGALIASCEEDSHRLIGDLSTEVSSLRAVPLRGEEFSRLSNRCVSLQEIGPLGAPLSLFRARVEYLLGRRPMEILFCASSVWDREVVAQQIQAIHRVGVTLPARGQRSVASPVETTGVLADQGDRVRYIINQVVQGSRVIPFHDAQMPTPAGSVLP